MGDSTRMEDGSTIGLDVGDRTTHVCVLEREGGVRRFTMPTTARALQERLGGKGRAVVALETGTHSPWVSRCLTALGHDVVVANARKVRLIGSGKKTDRVDAEHLARLARADVSLLSPIRHRSEQRQLDLMEVRARDQAVSSRTALINHVRGAVKSFGERLPSSSSDAFARRAKESLPEEIRRALGPLLGAIEALTQTVKRYDRRIDELCRTRYPSTGLLRQVRGVGALTALTYVLVLDSPERFRRGRLVGAYLGLAPRAAQSGDRNPALSISKTGDLLLRRLLVQSAHYILGPFGKDCTLRRVGMRRVAGGGRSAKKRAVVAVARRLAVLLLHLWRTAEAYDPLRGAPPLPASS